jgi:hypothetical protein
MHLLAIPAQWEAQKNYHHLTNTMQTKEYWQVIVAIAVVVLATVGVFSYTSTTKAPTSSESAQASITLTIESFSTPFHASIREGETVLEVLQDHAAEDTGFGLVTKKYEGLGILVESMHGMQNGTDGKYWQYKVNGVMPQVGADALTLHDGDTIEWFFAASSF